MVKYLKDEECEHKLLTITVDLLGDGNEAKLLHSRINFPCIQCHHISTVCLQKKNNQECESSSYKCLWNDKDYMPLHLAKAFVAATKQLV